MADSLKKHLAIEVLIVTVVLVAVTSVLYALQDVPIIGKYYGLIFATLFLYVPVFIIHGRKEKIDFMDNKYSDYKKSFFVFIITSIIVFPLFCLAAHGWLKIVYNASGPVFFGFPDFWQDVVYQYVMVALPEEFFFRGYMQTSLGRIFSRKWRILGANLGPAWILTAAIFAIAHSIVVLRWWHFSIFFPALLFGYLRERTGSITAPVLFHGTANVVMNVFVSMYVNG